MNANHYHIFWECQGIKTYWSEMYKVLQEIFGSHLPQSKVLFFGLIPKGWTKRDKQLSSILLLASKKGTLKIVAFTGEPSIDPVDRHCDGHTVYRMEGLTAELNYKKNSITSCWKKWIDYT